MPEFKIKLKVLTSETVSHQRHPPGTLAQWQAGGSKGIPQREDVQVTVVHLEPSDEHGHYNDQSPDSTDVHAMGYLDLRSIHPQFAELLKPGTEILLVTSAS